MNICLVSGDTADRCRGGYKRMVIKSNGYFARGTVIWELEGNQIEFTPAEFRDLMDGLLKSGLFAHLKQERPALLDQIHALYSDHLGSSDDEKELEYLLERCLFGLEQKAVAE